MNNIPTCLCTVFDVDGRDLIFVLADVFDHNELMDSSLSTVTVLCRYHAVLLRRPIREGLQVLRAVANLVLLPVALAAEAGTHQTHEEAADLSKGQDELGFLCLLLVLDGIRGE